jgi:hypothetical protein
VLIKQVAASGKASVPGISPIQRQIEDLRGVGHVLRWPMKLRKYIAERVDSLLTLLLTPYFLFFRANN